MKLLTLITGIVLGTIILASCQQNIGKVALRNEHDSASYSIGVSIGENLKNSPMKDINYDAMIRGLNEMMEDIEPEIDAQQANQIFIWSITRGLLERAFISIDQNDLQKEMSDIGGI